MTADVNGPSSWPLGEGRRMQNVPLKPGELPAVIVDISTAQALGYEPAHHLKSGFATVWPEFSEGTS